LIIFPPFLRLIFETSGFHPAEDIAFPTLKRLRGFEPPMFTAIKGGIIVVLDSIRKPRIISKRSLLSNFSLAAPPASG
jgi:hypothetical protein